MVRPLYRTPLALAGATARAVVSHGKCVDAITDLKLSVDEADSVRRGAMKFEESDLSRLQVYNSDGEIPRAWRPIKYRRRALAATEHERESEEKQLRKRRVLEVLAVLQ